MTVIKLKNGTTSITVICSTLSSLMYDSDNDAYVCLYSNWGYGLFAIITVIGLFVPVALIIYCGVKCHNKLKQHDHPPLTRESSQSSLYPSSGRNLSTFPDKINDHVVVRPRKSKNNKEKLYFPYPAYGTYEGRSLDGSTASLLGPPEMAVASPCNIPVPQTCNNRPSAYLSNSAPVVDSKLRDYRNKLKKSEIKNIANNDPCRSLKSLDSIDRQSTESFLTPFKGTVKNDNILKSNQSGDSFSPSTNSSSDASIINPVDRRRPAHHKTSDEENNKQKTNSIASLNGGKTESVLSRNEKDRILAATPTKNMVSRQDFDNYLVESVLKLPEDQRNGTFLIRDSSSISNCKVLTLYCKSTENNATLYYYKIFVNDEGCVYMETDSAVFVTVDELIAYHKSSLSIFPCQLVDSLGNNF